MAKRKSFWITAAGLLAAAAILWTVTAPRYRQTGKTERTTVAMGSVVRQTLYGANAASEAAAQKAAGAVSDLEKRISWRVEGSEIERLNGAGGVETACSAETLKLLQLCAEVAEDCGGAFDPCILPVSRLWDFDAEEFAPPSAESIRAALPLLGRQELILRPEAGTALLRQAGAGVDLGGVGKGAACDVMAAVYAEAEIDAAVAAVGGSILLYGEKADGSPWQVAVRDPKGGETEALGVLALSGGFVSTSGTYEKRRVARDGTVCHHLLDIRTGMPAETDLVSATVICGSGARSDALATAAVVLGQEKAISFLNGQQVAYLLINERDEIIPGGGAENVFTLTGSGYTLRKP